MNDEVAVNLENCKSEKACTKFFLRHFFANSFIDVFDFIAEHVDIDRSAPLTRYYCMSMCSRLSYI